jgi:hypothetical protein
MVPFPRSMSELETLTPERLFERFFWPLYPEDARLDLAKARTTDANPGESSAIARALQEIADTFAMLAPQAFDGEDLRLDGSDASVHRLGAALTRERRDRWAASNAPDGAPLLSHIVVHGTVYLGRCVVQNHGGAWRVRRPLWESLVRVRSAEGEGDLALFQWWLKSLSDAEIDRATLGPRYRQYVEVPRQDVGALRPIAPSRSIPRLTKVRYDTLHKHLRAHLPELRDLGEHFPSASRFAELGLRHLDFTWVGDGRMLLLHGAADEGVHLIWCDAQGFAKAAYFPCEKGSDYDLALEGDRLTVSVRVDGNRARHTLFWWGP